MRRPRRLFHISTGLFLLALGGCGQTGNLYLRAPPGQVPKLMHIPPGTPVLLPAGTTYTPPASATHPAPAATTRTPPRP